MSAPADRRHSRARWLAPEDPPGVLRLFFAVPLPAAARAEIGRLIDDVQGNAGDGPGRVRWVRVAGLHLTLRFLGPTPEEKVASLAAYADEIGRSTRPFDVELSGGGAFPSLDRPRSLWIGVTHGADDLTRLADQVGSACRACGIVLDSRPFAPHLTIARTDGVRRGPQIARWLAAAADEVAVRFTVDRLVLYRSILGRGPAEYEPLHEALLKP